MTVESRASIKQLPGWRRPLGSLAGHAAALGEGIEHRGIREALYELAGTLEASSYDELAAQLLEHWGSAEPAQIRGALRALVNDGALQRVGCGYVRREQS